MRAAIALLLLSSCCRADVVVLLDGSLLEGDVTGIDEKCVSIRRGKIETVAPKSTIAAIHLRETLKSYRAKSGKTVTVDEHPAFRNPNAIPNHFRIGIWKRSNVVAGGWTSSNSGSMVELSKRKPGDTRLPTNVSLFVYGSGQRKVDHVTLKLNLNDPKTADAGKERLIKMAGEYLLLLDDKLGEKFEAAIHEVEPVFDGNATPRDEVLLMESRNGFVVTLKTATGKMRAVSLTIRNPKASNLWD